MAKTPVKRYEFTITEIRTYRVTTEGASRLEAEQEAMAAFKRWPLTEKLAKVAAITKPQVVKVRVL